MLVRWKDLVLGQLLDTHLMGLRPLENFLDRFEIKKHPKKATFGQNHPIQSFEFWTHFCNFFQSVQLFVDFRPLFSHFIHLIILFWKAGSVLNVLETILNPLDGLE